MASKPSSLPFQTAPSTTSQQAPLQGQPIPNVTINDLDNLQAQLELYESSFNQLKKELPIYLSKHADTSKTCKNLIKSIKLSASSETNTILQSSLFTLSKCYDNIDNEMSKFSKSDAELMVLIEDNKKLVFSPYREILLDAAQSKKALTEKSLLDHVESSLNINHAFFEQYRMKYLIQILTKHLQTELRYHCKAVEELTSALSALNPPPSAS